MPDTAFAYVDSRGRRRLPLNDEAHVRNALARFNQTAFEDEAARDRARTRLLKAARKYGIVPVGFMTGQLRSYRVQAAAGRAVIELGGLGAPDELEGRLRTVLGDPTLVLLNWSESGAGYLDSAGKVAILPVDDAGRGVTLLERHGGPMSALVHDPAVFRDAEFARTVTAAVRLEIENERMQGEIEARSSEVKTLPSGLMTLLLADIQDSTGLVRGLGKRYPSFLADVRRLLRAAIRASGGREVDARADEMFAVFEQAPAALEAALTIQRKTLKWVWPGDSKVRLRVGLHTGRPTLTDSGYVGLVVNAASRICYAGHGGQIVLSLETKNAIQRAQPVGVDFRDLGLHQLQGLPKPIALYQVEVADLPAHFPPPRAIAAPQARTGHESASARSRNSE